MFETLFTAANISVLPFWIAMIGFPRAALTRVVAERFIGPGVAAVWYVLLMGAAIAQAPGGTGEAAAALAAPTIDGLLPLFSTRAGVAVCWAHFLAVDLTAGTWLYLDARRHGYGALVTAPLLTVTLLFAPIGVGLYAALRARRHGEWRAGQGSNLRPVA